jgi:hypothetical protein
MTRANSSPSRLPLDLPTSKPEDSGNWQHVRDSWVDDPRDDTAPHSDPPPLPESVRGAPAARTPEEAAFADTMLERLAASDYAGALMAADTILRERPTDADALDCAQICRAELQRVFEARLGSLESIAHLAVEQSELDGLGLDLGSLRVLAVVDGTRSLAEIVRAVPALPPAEALRALSELRLKRVIAVQ